MMLRFLALLFVFQSAYAETDIETIPLKHRMANDLLPHVEAILPKTAVVSAFNDKLIIKAERSDIQNVIELLKTIDVAQQSLMIHVLRTHQKLGQQSASSRSIEVSVADDVNAEARISQWSTRDSKFEDQTYSVRTLAGYPASISFGEDVPQQNQLLFISNDGRLLLQNNTDYISANNGFKALAQLLADNTVRIEIYPFFASIDRTTGVVNRGQLITSTVGPVGQWLEIGVISEATTVQHQGSTTYSSRGDHQQYIYLKVEPQIK